MWLSVLSWDSLCFKTRVSCILLPHTLTLLLSLSLPQSPSHSFVDRCIIPFSEHATRSIMRSLCVLHEGINVANLQCSIQATLNEIRMSLKTVPKGVLWSSEQLKYIFFVIVLHNIYMCFDYTLPQLCKDYILHSFQLLISYIEVAEFVKFF